MMMIPLPFVIALLVGVYLVFEVHARGGARRGGWLIAFLVVLMFQELLIGLRYGYGWDGLRLVQPLSAALIPPLAYLSFRRPIFDARIVVHLLPLIAVCLALGVLLGALDAVLAVSNLIYATLLIRLGLGGSDALAWAEVQRSNAVLVLLWLVAAVLLVSCITDAAIAYDFWVTQGENTGRIAGWTTIAGFVGAAGIFIWAGLRSRGGGPVEGRDLTEHHCVFNALNTLMQAEQLHLDPDINLNRIARRMVLPVRDVSRAVNTVAGCNVSQYVNQLRVGHACDLLRDTDTSITQILFASGFNTKSNFNREFARVTGQSPSAWRAAYPQRGRLTVPTPSH